MCVCHPRRQVQQLRSDPRRERGWSQSNLLRWALLRHATNATQLFNRQLSQAQFGGRSTTHPDSFQACPRLGQSPRFSPRRRQPPTLQPRSWSVLKAQAYGWVWQGPCEASGGGGHAVTLIALSNTGKGTCDYLDLRQQLRVVSARFTQTRTTFPHQSGKLVTTMSCSACREGHRSS